MNEMATHKVECPKCGQHYSLQIGEEELDVQCASCGAEFTVAPEYEEPQQGAAARPAAPILLHVPARQRVPAKHSISNLNEKIPGKLRWLLDVRQLLGWLKDGTLIRQVIGQLLQYYALIVACGVIYVWLRSFELFKIVSGATGTLGLILWLVFSIYGGYLVCCTIYNRGTDIQNLPPSSYVVAPIVGIFINLHGEIVFILCTVASVPATLITWAVWADLGNSSNRPTTP